MGKLAGWISHPVSAAPAKCHSDEVVEKDLSHSVWPPGKGKGGKNS